VSQKKSELLIRRILVALDASAQSHAALEAAANLAALLDAELVGMFVEDINLLRVAQLPFVREVSYPMAEMREINVPKMESRWRSQVTEARRQLSESANQRKVKWSFSVERGGVSDRLLAASLDMDLLAIGRQGRSLSQKMRLGSTARKVLKSGKRSVLLMRTEVDLEQPVLAIFDGSDAARQALLIASALARKSGRLRILVWTDDHDLAQHYKNEIMDQLRDQQIEISYRRFYPVDEDKLADVLQTSDAGLLVVGITDSHLPADTMQYLLERLDAPLLIIR
jgi:nucleotide-binding universal stress UspA family protein